MKLSSRIFLVQFWWKWEFDRARIPSSRIHERKIHPLRTCGIPCRRCKEIATRESFLDSASTRQWVLIAWKISLNHNAILHLGFSQTWFLFFGYFKTVRGYGGQEWIIRILLVCRKWRWGSSHVLFLLLDTGQNPSLSHSIYPCLLLVHRGSSSMPWLHVHNTLQVVWISRIHASARRMHANVEQLAAHVMSESAHASAFHTRIHSFVYTTQNSVLSRVHISMRTHIHRHIHVYTHTHVCIAHTCVPTRKVFTYTHTHIPKQKTGGHVTRRTCRTHAKLWHDTRLALRRLWVCQRKTRPSVHAQYALVRRGRQEASQGAFVCMCVNTCVCMYACMLIYMHISVYVCFHACMCMWVCSMHAYVHAHMHTCIQHIHWLLKLYTHTCIHTYTHTAHTWVLKLLCLQPLHPWEQNRWVVYTHVCAVRMYACACMHVCNACVCVCLCVCVCVCVYIYIYIYIYIYAYMYV